MPPFMREVGTAALGIGTSVANAAGNLIFGKFQQRQQLEGQKKALEQQNAANYDYWLKTNYSAQKEQLQKAGLNPGLLYGMGGGAGGQSGGANAMPEASRGQFDISGASAQMALIKAQADNLNADTKLKQEQALKTANADTQKALAEIEGIKQEIRSGYAKEKLTDIQSGIAKLDMEFLDDTLALREGKVQEEMSILGQKLRSVSAQADIDTVTKENVIKIVGIEVLQKVLTLAATKQGIAESKSRIQLNSEQGRALLAGIVQRYQEIELGHENKNVQEYRNELERQKIDLEKLTGIPGDVIQNILGAGILKQIVNPGRTVVEGFKSK